jgi:hypothetical protein
MHTYSLSLFFPIFKPSTSICKHYLLFLNLFPLISLPLTNISPPYVNHYLLFFFELFSPHISPSHWYLSLSLSLSLSLWDAASAAHAWVLIDLSSDVALPSSISPPALPYLFTTPPTPTHFASSISSLEHSISMLPLSLSLYLPYMLFSFRVFLFCEVRFRVFVRSDLGFFSSVNRSWKKKWEFKTKRRRWKKSLQHFYFLSPKRTVWKS